MAASATHGKFTKWKTMSWYLNSKANTDIMHEKVTNNAKLKVTIILLQMLQAQRR